MTKEQVLKLVDTCFHAYASDSRADAVAMASQLYDAQLEIPMCDICGVREADGTTNDGACQICEDRAILDSIAANLDEEILGIEEEGVDFDHVVQLLGRTADSIRKLSLRQG